MALEKFSCDPEENTRAKTAQTMAHSDHYGLLIHLQTVKTVEGYQDSCTQLKQVQTVINSG